MDLGARVHHTIEAIYATNLGEERWSGALQAIMDLTSSRAVTLDSFDRASGRHLSFRSFNVQAETAGDYLKRSGRQNARVVYGLAAPQLPAFHDGHVFRDERGIDMDPFYAEFLRFHGSRYFVTGTVSRDARTHTFLTLIRSPRQGPAEAEAQALFLQLLPHVRLAREIGDRLAAAGEQAAHLAEALDGVADGAALLGHGAEVLYSNATFRAFTTAGDGVRLEGTRLTFVETTSQDMFKAAFARALAPGEPKAEAVQVLRAGGAPAYVARLRPLMMDERPREAPGARVAVFLHDPLGAMRGEPSALAAAFQLTAAETHLAVALLSGVSPADYARRRGLSVNTVYTHLRRLKEKTGARRLSHLIRRLAEGAGGVATG